MLLPIFFACGNSQQTTGTEEDPIVHVDKNDIQMNDAISKARSTSGDFIKAFNSKDTTCVDFSVKYPFETSEGSHEHIWLTDIEIKGNKISGVVGNTPESTTKVQYGERVEVDAEKISDWMYVKKGELVGGYTIRVLRDMMSVEDRNEFDKSLSFVIK